MSRMRDHIRARKAGLSKAMRRQAEAKRCSRCDRKSAIASIDISGVGDMMRKCRFCGHEEVFVARLALTKQEGGQ